MPQDMKAHSRGCAWHRQGRPQVAEPEIARVVGVYGKARAPVEFLEFSKTFLEEVEEKTNSVASN